MRFILPHLVLASAVIASGALAVNSASAETVKVPFGFIAAGQNWPAGVYTVNRDSSGNTLMLSNAAASKSLLLVTGPATQDPTDSRVTLTFDNLATTHALRSVQYGSRITARLDKNTKENTHSSGRLSQGR